MLFTIDQQQEFADGLAAGGGDVEFMRSRRLQGHDSFLVDLDRFDPAIGDFLKSISRAPPDGSAAAVTAPGTAPDPPSRD